jgi:hypothetical protein
LNAKWSAEIPFDQSSVRAKVPQKPGVYEIRQSPPYGRYAGTTNVIKIGESDSDLQAEILNHFVRHTAANRLARIRTLPGLVVTVAFVELSAAEAGLEEARLLREFEDRHFDLPVLNSQRGYARDADRHYRAS